MCASGAVGRYEWYRHHAWAGLGFLSLLVALRYVFFLPNWFFVPVLLLLVVYVAVALVGTYRYSGEFLKQDKGREKVAVSANGKADFKTEKTRLKLEKKRLKAAYKIEKKMGKKK
ncbi:MAG: hypothetical protein DRN01_03930 [Thermoplasmata archaeon]|nr:MAG: hypothetical protein DRN01_03930 [Thermoplasmata archaeon]